MAQPKPNLLGLWKVSEADRKHLEKLLGEQKEGGAEEDVRALETTIALWQRLALEIDATRIQGELGDGLETRSYSVKDAWTSDEDLPVIDIEMRGDKGEPRQVSVLFLDPDKVMFQSTGMRIPLQRARN